VHESQRKIAGQEEEIKKLKAALASRPRNPDARVLELQQELQGFKLIAGMSSSSYSFFSPPLFPPFLSIVSFIERTGWFALLGWS